MSTIEPVESAGSKSKVSKGFGKLKAGPKGLANGVKKGIPSGISDGLKKGTDGLHQGLSKGAGGLNKGINGATKGVGGIANGVGGIANGVGGFANNFNPLRKSQSPEPVKPQQKAPEKPKAPPPKKFKRRLNTDLATFDWESVGFFQASVDRGGDGEAILAKTEAMKTYLCDSYYSDLYTNTVISIGTCFFSWLVAYLGGGILWLGVVFLCSASVYRAEFRRFVRDTRDDMLRLSISDRLESETETMEWLNSLMSKVWIIYMPLMEQTVLNTANPILAGLAPGGGIDSVELTKFNLGSVAPKITAIKSYTKLSKSSYEMDWAFAFDPNNRENMTKAEIRKQIMPKVILKTAIGKGIISKKVPINVEDMGFVGRMKIRLTFTESFPMIELIRVSFLEPPKIDYALKPLSGDAPLGLDIMKFIPGLKSVINEGINWGLKNYLIEPNYQEVNLVDVMNAASTDINAVLSVTLKDATLDSSEEHYIVLGTDNAEETFKVKTEAKRGTKNPSWGKTYHVLINSIDQNFNFFVYKVNQFGKDKLVGIAEFDLSECYQKDTFDDLSIKIDSNGRKKGFVNASISYFPELKAPELEDGTLGPTPESGVGILKFVLNEAKGLDLSSSLVGQISPYAEIFLDGKLKHKTRVLKRSNEPSFGDVIETLISSKGDTKVKIVIKDSVAFSEDTLLGSYEGNLEDIINQISSGNALFKLDSKGVVRLTTNWRPLALTDIGSDITHRDILGVFRVHIRSASDLKNLEITGKVDPYVKVDINGQIKFETVIHPETLTPVFEEVTYVPVVSDNQFITLEVFDAEKSGKDRSLGSTTFDSKKFMVKSSSGPYKLYNGNNKIIKSPLTLKNGNKKGELVYSVSFIPVTPTYTPKGLVELEESKKALKAKMEKEDQEQEKLKEEYKKNPDAFEWVDGPDWSAGQETLRKDIKLDKLLESQSGVLNVNVLKGKIRQRNAFLSVLVDEIGYPGVSLGPANKGTVFANFGNVFIRDLHHSKFYFRLASKDEVEEPLDVLYEKEIPTIELLKNGLEHPLLIHLGDNSSIEAQFGFNPSNFDLPASELFTDTGNLTVEVLDGEDLLSADTNGKSDPFAKILLNNAVVFKTEVVKKTLNPSWNELATFPIPSLSRSKLKIVVMDWDLAGDNDDLGESYIDLSQVQQGEPSSVTVPITLKGKPAGVVNLRLGFEPRYIRPQIQKFGDGLPGIGSVSKVPVKLVGGVAKGAIGGVGLLAGGVGKGGSKLIGALGGKKKKRNSYFNGSSDVQSTAGNSTVGDLSTSQQLSNNLSSSVTSNTNATAILGGKRSVGRISIKELHATSDEHHALQIKVLLKNEELGVKEVYKSRSSKLSGGTFKFGEESTFKAIPEDTLIVEAGIHHRLGKDAVIGTAEVAIGKSVDNLDDFTLEIPNVGELLLNIRYSAPN